jgi:hypothetical protein
MLWGTKQIADFKRLVKAGYAHTALGFNEYVTQLSIISQQSNHLVLSGLITPVRLRLTQVMLLNFGRKTWSP